jgi:hypothetical protein
MNASRSSISKARSYQEIGQFWDSHDLVDYWDQTRPADFAVAIRSETIYCPVEAGLAAKLQALARKRG